MNFEGWFEQVAGFKPHGWQVDLGAEAHCQDRLLRIPTGFGKTAGTVLSWLHHRAVLKDRSWPARLVFCLPMRVLVEQTEHAVHGWLRAANLDSEVSSVVLLGGRREISWLERPEKPTILIGTQDMLLSRALGRGYGSGRGLWPMEMGLLHRDALWVIDEVQLMDVGLATTSQLHGFRVADGARAAFKRPSFTWWMSATLQPDWLRTVDFPSAPIPQVRIEPNDRRGGLWEVRKNLTLEPATTTPEEIAARVAQRHQAGQTTLVIVNTVDRARKVHDALSKNRSVTAELRVVHSRFRGAERAGWDFLRRESAPPSGGRIIVATQVVEAGVDISAATLITELAPWSSLVQRFGRCARYAGESGEVLLVGAPSDERNAAPYSLAQLESACWAANNVGKDVGPQSLEKFEEDLDANDAAQLAKLYPYEPLHVLRRKDFDDLFDTTPDLSGADLDVSRYIRSGEERDISVFWRPLGDVAVLPRKIDELEPPAREELCPVPVGELRDLVAEHHVAYVRDYLSGAWQRLDRNRSLVPGMLVLLAAEGGGYDLERGWSPKSKASVPIARSVVPRASSLELTAGSADEEELSAYPWKSIATHGREAGVEARGLAASLELNADLALVLELVGRWHDTGKAHETFQAAIRKDARDAGGPIAQRRDLAKAPQDAWKKPPYPGRPGFRHELASTLMMLELLRRAAPDHAGLAGPHRALLVELGIAGPEPTPPIESALARELAALSPEQFDLALYLVCAHHGKVRTSWSTTPNDQTAGHGGIHGVCTGDIVRSAAVSIEGTRVGTPELELSLTAAAMGLSAEYGPSWGERVAKLLAHHGPFTLAYLEAIFRVADWRASQLTTPEDA